MRYALLLFGVLASSVAAEPLTFVPSLGTELRYEQYAADRLLGATDAVELHALPRITLSSGAWSVDAVSNAAIRVSRSEDGSAGSAPEAIRLDELKLRYSGLPNTAISVGRQRLGIAGAALTGDRDGGQTFDAARIKWSGFAGVSADIAFAWASSSMWADPTRPLPTVLPGDSVFAELNWASQIGTLSGYAYQIDQRGSGPARFRLLNQIMGAHFRGDRLIDEVKLAYSIGYVRQLGSVANTNAGAPTYWQIGGSFDFDDLASTRTNYRRFAANGISTVNGDTLSLATSANIGRLTLGAAYNDFRPVAETNANAVRDLRLSVGLIF